MKAKRHFQASILLNPNQITPYSLLAVVNRKLNLPDSEADKPIVEMMVKNKDSTRAYLTAFAYLRQYGLKNLPVYKDIAFPALTQEELVREALKRNPKDLRVLIGAAEMAQARGRKLAGDPKTRDEAPRAFAEAHDFLMRATQEHPKSPAPYVERAKLEASQGHVPDAIKVIEEGLAKLPDSVDLSLQLLEYQFDVGDAKGATTTLDKLRARGLSPELYDYESARVLILEEKLTEAVSLLERAIEQMKPEQFGKDEKKAQTASERIREANLLLGYCYAEMGENSRRLEAYTRALPLEETGRSWIRAMFGIAEAELALGRSDDALKTYRNLARRVPSTLISVGRLELHQALEVDAAKPNYSQVEETIARAERIARDETTAYLIPDLTEFELLRAAIENSKGQPAKARMILEALRDKKPKSVAVRIELAMQTAVEKAAGGIRRTGCR